MRSSTKRHTRGGQARALEALGRSDQAADAYRRFIALASSGSDLRVRAAELALDDIASAARLSGARRQVRE